VLGARNIRLVALLLCGALLVLASAAGAATKPHRAAPKHRTTVKKKRPAPAPRLSLGISDQNPLTFSDPLFVPLRIHQARFVVPWDAIYSMPGYLDDWLQAAQRASIQPLVAFEHRLSDRCPGYPCTAPTIPQYLSAFRAFRARYPWVHMFSPWNEANHQTQPTWHAARRAAQYYNAVRSACAGCRIVAADVLDESNMARWLRTFKRYAKAPTLWGLHNYRDANRFRTIGTKTLLRTVKGQIWLTETGGISAFTTSKGKVALPWDPARAARSMRFLFQRLVRLSPTRITRAYIFNWRGRTTETFDSALLNPDGTVRPVYWVVQQQSRRPAAPIVPARRHK
jgi:hypothetical protein